MPDKLQPFFKKYPLFILLLPVFFVLHGVVENYDFVSLKDAAELTGLYAVVSLTLLLFFWFFYKNFIKAALLAFLAMCIHFLFGSVYDGLKKIDESSFLLKYSVMLPILFLFFMFIAFFIKKKKQVPSTLNFYFNSLFCLLILFDAAVLVSKKISLEKEKKITIAQNFSPRSAPASPDIYFIIVDEYAGLKELADQLGFDNSAFENDLRQKDFYVIKNSVSNYASTPLSVASFLNMSYPDMKGKNQEQDKVLLSYEYIRKSILLRYFISQGYDIYNHSIFDLPEAKTDARPTFLPTGKSLVTSQTFLTRLETGIGFHLYTTLGLKENIEKRIYTDLLNNKDFYERTFKLASKKKEKPRFCYTHLMMPHYPYYYTKTGKTRPLKELLVENKERPDYYLEYLAYCNNKLLTLISEIREKSPDAIVVLTGDHGFRSFDKEVKKEYFFYNLCAVYLPSRNYSQFHEGLSSVNFFRALLNTEFQQHLPMLKDSLVLD